MNAEIDSSIVEQPTNIERKLSKELIGMIIALVLAIISIGYSLYLNQSIKMLQEDMKMLQQDLDNAMLEVKNRDEKIGWLENGVRGYLLNQAVSGNVVTNDFYIDRAMLTFDGDKISGRVDIATQPAFAFYYEGQGRFDLSDRELSASLLQLMKTLENYVESIGNIDVIDVSIQNYDVATYSQGKINLIGE